MSYYASGEGWFSLKNPIPKDIENKYESYFDDFCNKDVELSVCYYSKYHEEDIDEFLDAIKEYCTSGEFCFAGEDDSFWKYVLKDGEWHEVNGSVVYDDEPKLKLSENNQNELLGQLIDQAEDILFGNDDQGVIVGTAYDKLKNSFLSVLKNWRVL